MTLPYCEIPKAMYAWSCAVDHTRDGASSWWHLVHDTNGCGQRLIDLARSQHITQVYLYVGAVEWNWDADFSQGTLPEEDAVADLTTRLWAAGIAPWALWYLNDDPDDLSHADRVADLVASVAAFNTAHPEGAFVGLHGDQEPNDTSVYDAYLAMNAAGLAAADADGLRWAASLKPAWLRGSEPFYGDAMDTLSDGALMDYTDDSDQLASQGETFLSGVDGTDRGAEIAVETGWADPTPHVSLADLVQTDPEAFYGLLANLDAGFSSHPSYTGIAIHDYTQFFADLHDGVEPYDYAGDVETLCPKDTGDTDVPSRASSDAKGCGCDSSEPLGFMAVVLSVLFGALRRRPKVDRGSLPR